MDINHIVRSTCGICSSGCGVLVHLSNGQAVKIEGDPDSPISRGAICSKGLASLEHLYSPYRLRHPLKRIGAKGEGKWQQISWDEALDTIAEKLIQAKEKYGAESVAFIAGSNKGIQDTLLVRFSNAFGSPNHFWAGYTCFIPRLLAAITTYGYLAFPDYEYPPACLIAWGANVNESRFAEYGHTLRALDRGTRLIVIDPMESEFAKRANFWLRIKPSTDLALALGMINVIINEGLYDKEFVDKWTAGFDELKTHVQDYPPEKVEKITWVPAENIKEIARFYATNKPACIQWGNGLDTNINSFQACRAISILRAITGNLGIPGGELQWASPVLLNRPDFRLEDKIPADVWNKRVEAEYKTLPLIHEGLPQAAVKAMLYGEPYPIHAAYIQGCNPLSSWANAHETYKALQKLDFLAVSELFMTPTAALADIVLPAATYLEFNSIVSPPYYSGYQVQQKVTEVDECWSDCKTLNELAKRVGMGECFWENEDQPLDEILRPAGLTFEEFKKAGVIVGSKQYRAYQANGFATPSRKVDLYSSRLKEWGYDPLPVYYEIPGTAYDDPTLAEDYPLILTSSKLVQFRHSGGKQIATLRGSHPQPITSLHNETANKLGVKEGDWVYIETKQGKIKQKATLTPNIDPRVVIVDYGWWFPERDASDLYGWAESNINILTSNKPPFNRELGSPNFRGIACKVYKAEKGTSSIDK